jgi:GNAT superfamily N-acetyltransferase
MEKRMTMTPGDEALMLTLVETVNEADRAAIEQGLLRFNSERTPAFAQERAPENRASPLDVMVRDADGTLLGGLVAVTHWGWLDIGLLWLEERVRGQGYGTQVMRLAETEAQRRGCHASRLTTYSFQAKGFYEQLGYRVVGQYDDYPPGEVHYALRKDF